MFPIELDVSVDGINVSKICIRSGLTVLIGPNGSGKTHYLRALKSAGYEHSKGKRLRFIPAGRIGVFEQYRSDITGSQSGRSNYHKAQFGSASDANKRHVIESINGDFLTLSKRADVFIKVQERLKKLFKRDLIVNWDGGSLKVDFVNLGDDDQYYPSGKEASGLIHLIGILSSLYDDEVGMLFIDEPEVSLHPQLQAFLLNEIIEASGHPAEGGYKKIIIMATHSTEMLRVAKCDDLLSLVFCHDLASSPIQVDPNAGELKNKKIQHLITRLGQEHKLAFFCKRPLLVEGPSDSMLCSYISQRLEYHLEAAGSQILPVIGTGQMPVVSKFMKMLGKEPVVLADADAFADGLELANNFLKDSAAADKKAILYGAHSALDLVKSIYTGFCDQVDQYWDEISGHATLHPYWINSVNKEEKTVKRRSCFSVLFELEESVIAKLDPDDRWTNMKTRLDTALDVLEVAGCFILRKGAIESYYQSADCLTSEGKPSAALEEIEYLEEQPKEKVVEAMPEIIRCIKFAALGENICESEPLRDLVLAIAAPAMARLKAGEIGNNFHILNKNIVGEKADLFDISVENGVLKIDIKSEVLNVSGFPLELDVNEDVVSSVDRLLQTKK